MYDLSWLNPTPHAIAVYASQPLSPVTAQHSLSSGRYPLLGPDFHRLDRTSLRLAHSLDHLVGASKHSRRNVDSQRPRGFEVDEEVQLRRQYHWQLRWLLTLHDPADVVAGLPIGVAPTGAIAHEAAGIRLLAIGEDRRQGIARHQHHQL